MAFRSSQGGEALPRWLSEAEVLATQVRAAAVSIRDTIGAPTTNRRVIAEYCDRVAADHARLTAIASLPGIGAYAQEVYNNDVTYDISVEFTAMLAAMEGVVTFIVGAFPADAGDIKERGFDGQGRLVDRTFTDVQLAGLIPVLDTLIASITAPAIP